MRLVCRRRYGSWLLVSGLLAGVLTGCRGRQGTTEPVTARTIAHKHGPLTGKLLELAVSGEASRLVKAGKAEKREYTLGAGHNLVRVTEYWLLGEPFQIETVGRKYVDPIADIKDGQVKRISYGCSMDIGAPITDKRRMRRIIKLLRTESYEEVYRMAQRQYTTKDGWSQGEGVRSVSGSAGSSAIRLDIGGDKPIRIHGPLNGRFVTNWYFVNPPLAEFLVASLPGLGAEKKQRLGPESKRK